MLVALPRMAMFDVSRGRASRRKPDVTVRSPARLRFREKVYRQVTFDLSTRRPGFQDRLFRWEAASLLGGEQGKLAAGVIRLRGRGGDGGGQQPAQER